LMMSLMPFSADGSQPMRSMMSSRVICSPSHGWR
jgi:hypothetical protein